LDGECLPGGVEHVLGVLDVEAPADFVGSHDVPSRRASVGEAGIAGGGVGGGVEHGPRGVHHSEEDAEFVVDRFHRHVVEGACGDDGLSCEVEALAHEVHEVGAGEDDVVGGVECVAALLRDDGDLDFDGLGDGLGLHDGLGDDLGGLGCRVAGGAGSADDRAEGEGAEGDGGGDPAALLLGVGVEGLLGGGVDRVLSGHGGVLLGGGAARAARGLIFGLVSGVCSQVWCLCVVAVLPLSVCVLSVYTRGVRCPNASVQRPSSSTPSASPSLTYPLRCCRDRSATSGATRRFTVSRSSSGSKSSRNAVRSSNDAAKSSRSSPSNSVPSRSGKARRSATICSSSFVARSLARLSASMILMAVSSSTSRQ